MIVQPSQNFVSKNLIARTLQKIALNSCSELFSSLESGIIHVCYPVAVQLREKVLIFIGGIQENKLR